MEARPSLVIMIGGGSAGPRPNTIEKPEPMPKLPGEEDDEETEDDPEEDGDEEDDGSASPEERDNKRIVVEAMQALQGKHDNPNFALDEYIATYGQRDLDELRKLVTGKAEPQRAAQGRLVEGPGRGMEDRIPARVGHQPVLLSDGEYVLPADVVSGLGDGSTAGGVRVIESLMARVRRARTGTSRQASGLDLNNVLPR
jgi:hypothetical protein